MPALPSNNAVKLSLIVLVSFASLTLPLMGQPAPAPAPATTLTPPLVAELTASLDSLEREVLPALRSARDEASADTAAAQLEEAAPHIRLLAHILVNDLSVEEQKVVLPMLAPRLKQLLSQLDSCCSLSAELLSLKPSALGSARLARALTGLLDCLMGAPDGTTTPEDVPLALAEADAQIAAAGALLASLERLQDRNAVERELPTIRRQLEELRSLQLALSDNQRWSKTQLFLIMQRTRVRGAAVFSDLGKCTARLMGLTPPCYGSAELEALLTGLIRQR